MSRCLREWAFSSTYGKSGGAVWVGEERRGEERYPCIHSLGVRRAAGGGQRRRSQRTKALEQSRQPRAFLAPSLPHSLTRVPLVQPSSLSPSHCALDIRSSLRSLPLPCIRLASSYPCRLVVSLSRRLVTPPVTLTHHRAVCLLHLHCAFVAGPQNRLCRMPPSL